MSISVSALARIFQYNGMSLPDPDPSMSAESVRDLYSAQFAELTSAEVVDEGIQNDQHIYTFQRRVGEKG